jgi:hypothetical protein
MIPISRQRKIRPDSVLSRNAPKTDVMSAEADNTSGRVRCWDRGYKNQVRELKQSTATWNLGIIALLEHGGSHGLILADL